MPHLDWFSYTVKNACQDVTSVLHLSYLYLPDSFRELIWGEQGQEDLNNCTYEIQYGKMGYQECLKFDCGVQVFYNPVQRLKKFNGIIRAFSENEYENPDVMGTHFVINGSCFRSLDYFTPDDCKFFRDNLDVAGVDYNISRIDIAYDTDVDFSEFYNKYLACEYITKCRSISSHLDLNNRGTLYFGSRQSLSMIRIYDKGLEQGINEVWTRIEGEFKGECALQMFNHYIDGTCGDYFIGFLRFVDKLEKNKSRDCEVWEVYKNIIDFDRARKLSYVRNEDTLKWLDEQVGDTLKTVEQVYPGYIARLLKRSNVNESKLKRLEFKKLRMINELCDGSSFDVVSFDNEVVEQLDLFGGVV